MTEREENSPLTSVISVQRNSLKKARFPGGPSILGGISYGLSHAYHGLYRVSLLVQFSRPRRTEDVTGWRRHASQTELLNRSADEDDRNEIPSMAFAAFSPSDNRGTLLDLAPKPLVPSEYLLFRQREASL